MKNVILLTIDTLRKDVLGCYGGGNLTPFIDSIQDKCIRFNNAHSPGPYTQAAFPGILTSSYYLEYGRQKKLSEKRILISEILHNSGVITAGFHSNPYLCDYFGYNRGWDIFYDSMDEEVDELIPYIKASALNNKVAGWLSGRKEKKDKPFFIWLHYMDIHEPYFPEQKYIEFIDPSIDMTNDDMFALFKNIILKRDVSDKNIIELLRKLYLAHVREVDEAIRRFFGILEEVDLLKNSIIIITSDHGEEFNEHGGLSHDGKMYSELVDVPLILYDHRKEGREVCETLVSTLDIAPTILYLLGLDPVDAFNGHSLLPLESYPSKGIYGEAIDKHGSREKVDEKEIHYYMESNLKIIYRERNDSWELYDLKADPKELNNIINVSPQADIMKQKLTLRVRRYDRRVKNGN